MKKILIFLFLVACGGTNNTKENKNDINDPKIYNKKNVSKIKLQDGKVYVVDTSALKDEDIKAAAYKIFEFEIKNSVENKGLESTKENLFDENNENSIADESTMIKNDISKAKNYKEIIKIFVENNILYKKEYLDLVKEILDSISINVIGNVINVNRKISEEGLLFNNTIIGVLHNEFNADIGTQADIMKKGTEFKFENGVFYYKDYPLTLKILNQIEDKLLEDGKIYKLKVDEDIVKYLATNILISFIKFNEKEHASLDKLKSEISRIESEDIQDEEQFQILGQISKASSFDQIIEIVINTPTKRALSRAIEVLESVNIKREKENIIISGEWGENSEMIEYRGTFIDDLNINIPDESPIRFKNGNFYYHNHQLELK